MQDSTIQIPPGYKMTEIGVIPQDWQVEELQDLVDRNGLVRGPFGGALKKEIFVKAGYKVYEQKNAIYKSNCIGEYYVDQCKFEELKRFEVKEKDFIVSCSGTIGKIYQIPFGSEKGIINQALLKIKINPIKIHDLYFGIMFNSDLIQNKIIDTTQGGAMKNLVGMDIFKKTLFILPNIQEQQSIATALTDIDSLISELDILIVKKQAIKHGAMQQLLTGKKRLAGFSGEREEKRLGEIVNFYKGKGLPKIALVQNGNYKCIHYGELFTKYNELIDVVRSSTNENINPFFSRSNDVLMPTSDVTPNGLATASCIKEDGVVLGGDILVIRPYENTLDGTFLSYSIAQEKSQVMQLVSGTTVFHLYASDMSRFIIKYPSVEEQLKIIKTLTDMDNDIQNTITQRDKYKLLKQGMMQQLLTGKIRLKTTA